jgi:CubicO group peptidase (beta-lactamase class C family)
MKRLGWILLVLFIVLNLWLAISGNTYVYRAIIYNYAGVDDMKLFAAREIKNGEPREWPVAKDYNQREIAKALQDYHVKNKSIAYVIIKDDSIRYEQYWEGYGPASLSNSFSMAKSYISILIGIAVDEGKIKGIDEPISNYLPSYKTGKRSQITIRQVLTMSAGLNWDESYSSITSPTTKAYYGTDLQSLMDDFDLDTIPGKVFNYQSGATQLLAFALENATGKHVAEYLSEKLWKPLNAVHAAQWSLDHVDGEEKSFCCIYSNARDFARLGKLMINHGNWNGKQIVSAKYVEEAIKPAPLLEEDGKPNERYGFQWWMLPEYRGHYIFYMRGLNGQYVICVPDMNMIVVRLGEIRDTSGSPHPTDFYHYLDGALDMYDKQ